MARRRTPHGQLSVPPGLAGERLHSLRRRWDEVVGLGDQRDAGIEARVVDTPDAQRLSLRTAAKTRFTARSTPAMTSGSVLLPTT